MRGCYSADNCSGNAPVMPIFKIPHFFGRFEHSPNKAEVKQYKQTDIQDKQKKRVSHKSSYKHISLISSTSFIFGAFHRPSDIFPANIPCRGKNRCCRQARRRSFGCRRRISLRRNLSDKGLRCKRPRPQPLQRAI